MVKIHDQFFKLKINKLSGKLFFLKEKNMKFNSIRFIITIFLVLPFITQTMLRPLIMHKRSFSRNFRWKPISGYIVPGLQATIINPHFSLIKTKAIIAHLPQTNIDSCKVHSLIENIVFKATEYKENEKKYAIVLSQLREQGWKKSNCCANVMLHSAVISDLPLTTRELLLHDPEWVHTTDFHNCVPIDYAQSPTIIRMLKNAGSRDAQPYTGKDKWYRVPNYGWQLVTPLRKAVYDGHRETVREILSKCTSKDITKFIHTNELEMLQNITDLRFWRTKDKKYLAIKKDLSEFHYTYRPLG